MQSPSPTPSSLLVRFGQDRRGNVALMAALLLPTLLGVLGLGTEVASWYGDKRSLQNAADSAAIAAATNAGATYADEARAVAAQYGFVHGTDGVTVTAQDRAACPAGGNSCFRVTVTRARPLLLAQFAGFGGDATVGGEPGKAVSAVAVAEQATAPRPYCLLALAGSGAAEGIRSNGAPMANLSGCNVMSNTGARCNGHDLRADFGAAHTTNNGCGVTRASGVARISDPYAGRAANIPSDPCGGTYHVAPRKKKDPPLPSTNQLHGLSNWSGSVPARCGDVELTGPTLIDTGGANAVLVIHNGRLDLNGYTLQTTSGSSLTIVFTGSDPTRAHAPVGGGTLDIKAPASGPWSGVAVYQSPTVPSTEISEAGNSPTWNITGLVYLPRASVTFSGAVNKSSNGVSCFVLVVDNITINGTGSILAGGQCAAAGLTMPATQTPSRGRLVS